MPDCLIADGDAAFALHVARSLRDDGMTVELASAAFAALELIRLRRFDAVVTDTGFDGITGPQLLRGIRRLDRAVALIALTDEAPPGNAAANEDAVLGWVQRPTDAARISGLVRPARRGRIAAWVGAPLPELAQTLREHGWALIHAGSPAEVERLGHRLPLAAIVETGQAAADQREALKARYPGLPLVPFARAGARVPLLLSTLEALHRVRGPQLT